MNASSLTPRSSRSLKSEKFSSFTSSVSRSSHSDKGSKKNLNMSNGGASWRVDSAASFVSSAKSIKFRPEKLVENKKSKFYKYKDNDSSEESDASSSYDEDEVDDDEDHIMCKPAEVNKSHLVFDNMDNDDMLDLDDSN